MPSSSRLGSDDGEPNLLQQIVHGLDRASPSPAPSISPNRNPAKSLLLTRITSTSHKEAYMTLPGASWRGGAPADRHHGLTEKRDSLALAQLEEKSTDPGN